MARHNETGKRGEEIACNYLRDKGYLIKERNWRWKKAEIDIIALDGDILVFVEVKTRTSLDFGLPAEFVTPKKEAYYADASSVYMEAIDFNWEVRFDIISVLLHFENAFEINHHKDAFFSGW